MKTHTLISFDREEKDQIDRALAGIVNGPDTAEQPNVLRRFLNSATQGDQFSHERLVKVVAALDVLINELAPQTSEQWWRDIGAPGSDDAIAGLALERQHQVVRLTLLQASVRQAVKFAGREYRERLARVEPTYALTA